MGVSKIRFAELAVGDEFSYCGFELRKECPHSASGGGKRWFMTAGDLVLPKPAPASAGAVVPLDPDEDDPLNYPYGIVLP